MPRSAVAPARPQPRPLAIALALLATVASGLVVPAAKADGLPGGPLPRFGGVNLYMATSLPGRYTCGGETTDGELSAALDAARASGQDTVRSWFFQSFAKGGDFTAFDRLLEMTGRRGMRVIPVIANHQPHCEPSAERWKDLAYYRTGYRIPGAWGYQQSMRDYARSLARRYRGDRRIRFWQVMNEAETSSSNGRECAKRIEPNGHSVSANVLRAFADDVTGVLRTADPTHRVSLGVMGSNQCGAAHDEYEYVHAGAVNICDYHDYNDEVAKLPGTLQQRVEQCTRLRKQLVVTESGIQGYQADRCFLFGEKIVAAWEQRISGYVTWGNGVEAATPGTTDGFGLVPRGCSGVLSSALRTFKQRPPSR